MIVWAAVDPDTLLAIRIFKNHKAMVEAMPYVEDGPTQKMDRGLAVSQIRRQIWNRQEGLCARCPQIITFLTSQMHEKIHRGEGGEISLENSELLCAKCHQDAHPEKRVLFTK